MYFFGTSLAFCVCLFCFLVPRASLCLPPTVDTSLSCPSSGCSSGRWCLAERKHRKRGNSSAHFVPLRSANRVPFRQLTPPLRAGCAGAAIAAFSGIASPVWPGGWPGGAWNGPTDGDDGCSPVPAEVGLGLGTALGMRSGGGLRD